MKARYTLSLLILAASIQPLAAAVEFTASVIAGPRDRSAMRGWVDGPNARVEFIEGQRPGMEKGSYMLTRDGGNTITLVNPKEKTYMEINPEQLASSVGQFMNAAHGLMSMTFKNAAVETLADEKGQTMLGLPTRRVKTRTSYTVETRVFGSTTTSHVTRDDEIWVTPKMSDPGFSLLTKQRSIRTGNEDIDKLIELESAKITGFPLKTVSRTVTRDARGREESATTIYEITSLKEGAAPAGAFEVPAGYKDGMAELGENLRKAQQDMESERGGEADGAPRDAINSLMKGLFRR